MLRRIINLLAGIHRTVLFVDTDGRLYERRGKNIYYTLTY